MYLKARNWNFEDRVAFLGGEYSAEGMHPDPKKVQGIIEMTPPPQSYKRWNTLSTQYSVARERNKGMQL